MHDNADNDDDNDDAENDEEVLEMDEADSNTDARPTTSAATSLVSETHQSHKKFISGFLGYFLPVPFFLFLFHVFLPFPISSLASKWPLISS